MATTLHNMAIQDGKSAGRAAASWVFDGNSPPQAYERVLKGIQDGDPEVLDSLRTPNLSGEYADDPTPQTLAQLVGLDEQNDPEGYRLDELCTVWEDAASMEFWSQIERTCKRMLT